MTYQNGLKFQSLVEFWEYLPEDERTMVDILRQVVLETLPAGFKEKLTNNVPYYFGKKRICMIWPGAVPCGGIKKGVLFGFSYGNRLEDASNYLTHGTNKRIFYKIYKSVDQIEIPPVISLLKEAIDLDKSWK